MKNGPNQPENNVSEEENQYIDPSDPIENKPKTYNSAIEYILSMGFPSIGTIIQFFFIPFPGVNSAFTGDIKVWLTSLFPVGAIWLLIFKIHTTTPTVPGILLIFLPIIWILFGAMGIGSRPKKISQYVNIAILAVIAIILDIITFFSLFKFLGY